MTDSLLRRIERGAARGKGVRFADTAETEHVPWARLLDDARLAAAAMQARGVGPGDRVAVLGATSRPLFTALEAVWLAGAAAVVPPLPTRLASPDEFRTQTRGRVTLADVALTVCTDDLVPIAEAAPGDRSVVTVDELDRQARAIRPGAYERPVDDPAATAVLQFTSGSTSDPKGVVIPHSCVMDNLDAAAERAPMRGDDDVVVSWLPLYHDMGLVYTAVNTMTNGTELVLAPPTRFVGAPGWWMAAVSEFGGTWTIGPNFALAVAARLLARSGPLDLGRCHRLGSGSEPVQADVMQAMAEAGAAQGLASSALYAGYGMAEATVAISIPLPGSGFGADVVDGEALEHDLRAEPVAPDRPGARSLARCGPPLRGMELRVVDPVIGGAVEERRLGEIEVRGPSVVPGYFRRPDATAAAFRPDGWLRTGDLGYLAEGDVVVGGRIKDVIMVGGRNLFPEDLERAAQSVAGVRAGNVIAFGVDDRRRGEGVVVVAEIKEGEPALVRDGIARAVRQAVGLRPSEVVLLPAGALPKTSSGKLRRSICRARYEAAEMETL